MNIIVLAIDGLQAGYLGCYGNAWIGTPEVDRLASQSIVFDQAFVDSPHLERLQRAYWQGTHALGGRGEEWSLARLLEQSELATTLLSDEPEVAQHALAGDFDDVVFVEPAEVTASAEEVHDTQLARVFAAATDWLADARRPFLLWVHARGMLGPWDAPLEYRYRYVDEGEDEVEAEVPVPHEVSFAARRLPEEFDPDELLGIRRAYAGQVALVDACLGGLLEAVDQLQLAEDTLLVVTAPRGYPLGEHRRLGLHDDALYEELIHVPLLIRPPGGMKGGTRTQALVQPSDLFATLVEGAGLEAGSELASASLLPLVREEAVPWRDRICLGNAAGERAIRTPAWYLRRGAAGTDSPHGERIELYGKPDDRWEVNEVAARCQEIAEALGQRLDECEQALKLGEAGRLAPLDEVLVVGLE